MKITITGGAGFLGVKLARSLLADNALGVEQLNLVDMVAPPSDLAEDARVQTITGDAADEDLLAGNLADGNGAARMQVVVGQRRARHHGEGGSGAEKDRAKRHDILQNLG